MKVVILAGGFGSRISENSHLMPKPLISIGGKPILWHICKIYEHYNIKEFIICCGYKGHLIKEYFQNYFLHFSDVKVDLSNGNISYFKKPYETWQVTLIDTGLETQTGGRIKRIQDYVGENFCLTYGDGLSDVNINDLIQFHKRQDKIVTVTAVRPPGRFGSLLIENEIVNSFVEKPIGDNGWINGGFFVCKRDIFDLIEDDNTVFEQGPLKKLANIKQLSAFKHSGFWSPMDTLRDKNFLNEIWEEGSPPWKKW